MIFHLILIGVPLALLGMFLAVVAYEERAGRRLVLSGARYHFDRRMERTSFIIRHVDWGAFFNDLTRSGAERLLHDLAHTMLIGVRAAERELTSLVRTLRARREPQALLASGTEGASRVAATVTYIRKAMRRSRKLPVHVETPDRVE